MKRVFEILGLGIGSHSCGRYIVAQCLGLYNAVITDMAIATIDRRIDQSIGSRPVVCGSVLDKNLTRRDLRLHVFARSIGVKSENTKREIAGDIFTGRWFKSTDKHAHYCARRGLR